jgi:hypothetical protein
MNRVGLALLKSIGKETEMEPEIQRLFAELMVEKLERKICEKLEKFYPPEPPTPTLADIEALIAQGDGWDDDEEEADAAARSPLAPV